MLDRKPWKRAVSLKRQDGMLLAVATTGDALAAIALSADCDSSAFTSARDALLDVMRGAISPTDARETFAKAVKDLGFEILND